MSKKYKTKQLITAQRGTLVLTCRITDYDGNWSYQEGVATDNNLRDNWDAVVHEAQLNAVYKHMAHKNKYIKKSEDGASVDTYVKAIDVTDWYILYYNFGGYEYKRVSKDKKLFTQTYRKGELVREEEYKKGNKSDLLDITKEFIVVTRPKTKRNPRQTKLTIKEKSESMSKVQK